MQLSVRYTSFPIFILLDTEPSVKMAGRPDGR